MGARSMFLRLIEMKSSKSGEIHEEIDVAMAAPFTPICRAWMNSALSTAFMTTETMLKQAQRR